VAAPPIGTGPAIDTADALAALLRGAGVPPAALHQVADPLAVFEQAGATLRAAIGGLRALLIARADVKREFRIEQTMLRAAGNNPVKFAATDEAAVAALLVAGPRGTRAVADTVGDLTAHEVATLAATQAAARALLLKLAPELVDAGDAGGGLFGASREKRLWEAYRRLHAQVVDQFDDDFDSAFGKEFARAYEQAVAAGSDEPERDRRR
jgi:type VI secretion system protein ImpI/type VI secretion system protein